MDVEQGKFAIVFTEMYIASNRLLSGQECTKQKMVYFVINALKKEQTQNDDRLVLRKSRKGEQ